MKIALNILIFFLYIFFPILGYSSQPEGKTNSISSEEYQYQNALYFYLTGDYLSSSILSSNLLDSSTREKDKAILLLKLSDIKRLAAVKDYPIFTFQTFPKDASEKLRLFDLLYKMGEYERVFLSRKLSNKGASLYFEGISLLQLNRLGDSRQVFLQIKKDDEFYPYAMIALCQIEAMKQNIKEAEIILKDIMSQPSVEKEGLAERLYLLYGQILFEKGFFSEAQKEFLKISSRSQFYKDSIVGQAWSLIKMGSYDRAVALLRDIKLVPPYTPEEQEIQIALGYSYLKAGMAKEAVEHFQMLSDIFFRTENSLEKIIVDKTVREVYISNLIEQGQLSPKPLNLSYSQGALLSDKELFYISILRTNQELSNLLEEYELLNILKDNFLKKEEMIRSEEIRIENMIKGVGEMLKKITDDIGRAKDILNLINNKVDRNEKIVPLQVSNILKDQIVDDRWHQILKKQITKTEKKIVGSVLYEAIDAMQCLDSPVTCPILNMVVNEKSKMDKYNKIEDIKKILMIVEMFGRDIDKLQSGERIEFENNLLRIVPLTQEMLKKGDETIKELDILRDKLKSHIKDTDKAMVKIMAKIDNHVMERFIKIKYELSDFKDDIIAGLDKAKIELEKDIKSKEAQKSKIKTQN